MSATDALRRLTAAQQYLEVGRYDRALDALGGLDAELAGDPWTLRLRASALYGLERFAEAAAAAAEGLEENPEDEALLYLLSLAYEQQGDLARAEAAILAALRLVPDGADLLSQYASLLMRGGQLDKAGRILGHAAQIEPDSATVLGERISLAYLRHDEREARRLSEELLAVDPESLAGQRMLGALELSRGKARRAQERFADAVRSDPADRAAAGAARSARRLSNPLLWPARFFARYGAAPTWVGAMVVIFGLRAAGADTASLVATVVWLVMCVTSWVAVGIEARAERRR